MNMFSDKLTFVLIPINPEQLSRVNEISARLQENNDFVNVLYNVNYDNSLSSRINNKEYKNFIVAVVGDQNVLDNTISVTFQKLTNTIPVDEFITLFIGTFQTMKKLF